MTDSKKTYSRVGLALIAATVLILVFSRCVLVPMIVKTDLEALVQTIGPTLALLLTDLPNFLFLLVFWLVIRTIPKSEWQRETMSFRSVFQIFVMMYAVSMSINLIGLTISKAAPAGGSEQLNLISDIVTSGAPIGIMMTVIIAPLVEELIFRKLMLDRIRNYGEKTAIVFSALCFGLFHGNLTQFMYAFSVGLFLGYVYCKTGKVIYTMIMHALLNMISSSIMLLAPAMGIGAVGKLLLAASALVIAVMFVLGFIQLIRHLRTKDLRTDDSMPSMIPKREIAKTVYLNPCVLLFVLYYTSEIVMDLFKITL
jgi:membrane protease YdiL (CAAX protease family)